MPAPPATLASTSPVATSSVPTDQPGPSAVVTLNVPYAEKDAAKALGAKWDPSSKKWFVPAGVSTAAFAKWLEPSKLSELPEPLLKPTVPKTQLFVDLVPRSAWFSNLRSELLPAEWNAVKRATFQRAGYLCEICGGKGRAHPVECHERWKFGVGTQVQTLLGTVALCPACHLVTHFGFAEVQGRAPEARTHLMAVNGWTERQAREHVTAAFQTWRELSRLQWVLNATWLLEFVRLSEQTAAKIERHARGLEHRDVPELPQATTINHKSPYCTHLHQKST